MTIDCTLHGGPDSGPPITWDFSSNANVLPLPADLLSRMLDVDRRPYPDPSYTGLRVHLARCQGVAPDRIVPTAGSSEGIRRLTLAAYLSGVRDVWVPQPGYGDYRAAAQALGMRVHTFAAWPRFDVSGFMRDCGSGPVLLWLCEPCNPTGHSLPNEFWQELADWVAHCANLTVALDRAYEPLRLDGQDPVPETIAAQCWQLYSPNKALGLTGVRAGWMQAPVQDRSALVPAVYQLAPAWVLSAEGVSVLLHWHHDDLQSWVGQSRETLHKWRQVQQDALSARGWLHQPSCTPYVMSHHPALDARSLTVLSAALRVRGIKWRDVSSMGESGCVRWRAHEPAAQQALLGALDDCLQSSVGTRSAA